MQRAVIIVAAGKGKRMNVSTPKQFITLKDRPILVHTIQKFLSFDPTIKIYLVLNPDYIDFWLEVSRNFLSPNSYQIVEGGQERYHSVRNAVKSLSKDIDIVAIHDGVRPLIDVKTIANCFMQASLKDNAIPYIAPSESVRIIEGEDSKILNRDNIRLVQTPQVFMRTLLDNAYNQEYCKEFTDDASVVEKLGCKINLVEGSKQNIKITTFDDLKLAEFLMG